jgi:SPP1 family predicted phage head-tail adaptor
MAIIGAGRLNEHIEIWCLDIQTTEYGDTHEEWKFICNARAMVDHTGGNLSVENHELWNSYTKDFTVRIHTNVQDSDRIKYNDHWYRIITIDIDRGRQTKIIRTELVNE